LVSVFARYAPARRPLTVLDLGTGSGHLGPVLADEFGGPVHGVEPSAHRRRTAQAHSPHPRCHYIDGRAESVPLPDSSVDLVLMFLSLHHITDRPRAFAEVSRVARDGAVILVVDRVRELPWHHFFPAARARAERAMPTVAEIAAAPDLDLIACDRVEIGVSPTMSELYRIVEASVTASADAADPATTHGLAAMAALADAAPNQVVPPPVADLLVLRRCDRQRTAQP
jgi:SAM-dependent methyltransferase